MNEVREVSGTAFVVAEFRARENAEPHPLYLDPIVPIFLDDRTKRAADAISDGFPAAATNVRLRTRYFDDRLDEHLARAFNRSSSSAQGSIHEPRGSASQALPISRSMTRTR